MFNKQTLKPGYGPVVKLYISCIKILSGKFAQI